MNGKNIKNEYKEIYNILLFDNFLKADEIIRKTGKPAQDVITKLTLMELDEIIEKKSGLGYRKIMY